MKKNALPLLAIIALIASCTPKESAISTIEKNFENVPEDVRIGCYWYWISNNISADGVVKDLESMKDAGITRAYIGNVTTGGLPLGDVDFMSEEWWRVTRAAFKTAGDLDIELGTFNSPGWSQSGGPWISEDQSMRYVAFEESVVCGDGSEQTIALPDVPAQRIISAYAFPAIEGRSEEFSRRDEGSIHIKLGSPMTVRSMLVSCTGDIEGWSRLEKDGKVIKEFYFNRSNWTTHVGWDPAAPQVESVPEVEGDEFTFTIETQDKGEIRVVLSDIPYVEEYAEKTIAKMYQGTLPPWEHYMWETHVSKAGAKVASETMVDLSGNISDGAIKWAVPEGKWSVVTAYAKTTGVENAPAVPEATGLEVDKMNKEHIRYHFDSYLGEILRRIPAEERKTFKLSVLDSYEMGGQNWTDGMAERFEQTYGYDMKRFLPAMQGYVVDSEEQTDRFLWDLRRLISDGIAYDYVKGLREVCNENGLETWLENYGHWGFPSEFLLYGGQSDQVAGEFWAGRNHAEIDIECKDASSCGHIYGKKQIWAESSTSGDMSFQRSPAMLKPGVDNSFIAGINATLLHVYIQQPDDRMPGISAWFGTEFNRHNTWFSFMDLYTDYLRRCNYLLQQGQYVADVAYFIGEDAPKMDGVRQPEIPEGYCYDYINAEVLSKYSHVEDGCLVLDSGMRYRVLVLPPQKTMRPEMLECIAGLVRGGLTVIGPQPEKSPSLQGWPDADAKVSTLAGQLWGGDCGKGRIYPEGTTLETVFAEMGVSPDCLFEGDDIVRYVHRRVEDADIFFIASTEDHPVSVEATFRATGRSGAEIWDPVQGSRKGLAVASADGVQKVSLPLEAYGSAFVVLRDDALPVRDLAGDAVALGGPWKVSFEAVAGNEAFEAEMPELCDWAESADPAVRYFSGTAHYSAGFEVEGAAEQYVLDLGQVMVMAKVRINGQYAGGVWTPPYKLDITPYVHDGANTIEVDVANNWINRLIGDQLLPESERHTWTHNNPATSPDAELQASGLIGPVTISALK